MDIQNARVRRASCLSSIHPSIMVRKARDYLAKAADFNSFADASVCLHPGECAEDGSAEGLTARNTRMGTGAFARSPELSRPELLSDYLCHLAASDQF
jgi:hypothetical protein